MAATLEQLQMRLAKAREAKAKKARRAENKLRKAGKPMALTTGSRSSALDQSAKQVLNKKGGKRIVRAKRTGGSGTSSTALKVDKSTAVGRKLLKDAGMLKPVAKAKRKSSGQSAAKVAAQQRQRANAAKNVMKKAAKKGGYKKLSKNQRKAVDKVTASNLAASKSSRGTAGMIGGGSLSSPFFL